MKRTWITLVALAALLVVPGMARAHEGHSEKVLGTVSSIDGKNLMVKTTAGKTIMVMMDAKTRITRAKATLTAADVKVGDRVVAEGPLEKDMLMATSLQLGAAPSTAAAPSARRSRSASSTIPWTSRT
jgi:hypothetical protein